MAAGPRPVNPLELAPPGLTFEELEELRAYLERTLGYAQASLRHYYDPPSGGFFHKIDPEDPPVPGDYSKASTATCLAFLGAAGLLQARADVDQEVAEANENTPPWSEKLSELRREIIFGDWDSAGLGPDNPFTVSFLLEAVHLLSGGRDGLENRENEVVNAKIDSLIEEVLRNGGQDVAGGVRIEHYPPTAFLTQAAVRVLQRWERLSEDARGAVESWTWSNLHAESVLVASGSPDADFFELVYSVLTASAVSPIDKMTPQQRRVLEYALDQFFSSQIEATREWPRSRPLFLYPNIGYAYCFDYELLVQLLSDAQLFPMVYSRLDKLRLTALQLDRKKYPLGEDGYGWSSGHHGQRRFAESWSTASVFHFCFVLQRYVAEAIRRHVFDYAGGRYTEPTDPPHRRAQLPDAFLDSRVRTGEKSLTRVIEQKFLQPILDGQERVRQGRPFPANVPVSAIFFGAPGTSKTELAKLIGVALGWPFLALDPSHLTRNGLDQVHAEAHHLFSMLQSCEEVVVLLDEFDELVREREREGEIESRFLTTAMLPKLAALSARRRLVYIIATNHLEQFDLAIRRPGRFDMILPIRPPTAAAKLKHWPILKERLDEIATTDKTHATHLRRLIDDLTYLECKRVVARLHGVTDLAEFTRIVTEEGESATISQPVHPGAGESFDPQETWRDRVDSEVERIRIPEP